MSKKQSKKSAWILALLMLGAFTFAFQLGAVSALAACGSGATLDTDCDGFIDSLENSGFTLTPGMSLAVYPTVNPIPNCAKAAQGTPRDACVDPATQDYFVIIQRGTNPCTPGVKTSCGDPCGPFLFGTSDISDIPTPSGLLSEYKTIYGTSSGPLQWVSGIATGFTTHEIYQNPSSTNQVVTSGGWYAVKITEDLNPCSSWMGLSTPGTITPTAPGSATVWPEKIMNWIDRTCSQTCFTDSKGNTTCYYAKSNPNPPSGYSLAPGFICKNANNSTYSVDMNVTNPDLSKLYHDFIKNVVSHEASHLIHLAFGPGTSADNHWPAGSGTLMEQSIATKTTRDKNGNITVNLYISTGYASQDPAQHALK